MKRSDFRTTHKKLASGPRIYYYAKSSGACFYTSTKLIEAPYPQNFIDKFNEVNTIAGECADMIDAYLDSPRFVGLAPQTQQGYRRSLTLAKAKFGQRTASQMEQRAFRGEIIDWQEDHAKTSPRAADLHVTALSCALNYAHRKGKLMVNPAANIEPIYTKNETKEPWSEEDAALFLRSDCPRNAANAFRLAKYTGLRVRDLAALRWDAWHKDHIKVVTSKGRGRRIAVFPLTSEASEFVSQLKSEQMNSSHGLQPTMLTSDFGAPLKPATISDMINRRAAALDIEKTAHQLRNTYVSLIVKAGIPEDEIPGIMGWSLSQVKELIRIYVKPEVIAQAQIERLKNVGELS